MPKISQVDDDRDISAPERQADLPEVARTTDERSADAARGGVRLVRAAAGAGAGAGETARRSVEATVEAGQGLVESLGEQALNDTRAAGGAAADIREAARRSAEATADTGRMLMEILGEQTRHNMTAAAALARAVNWTEVIDLQRDFIGGSLGRMNRFGECYRQLLWRGTTASPFAFRQ